MVLCVRFCRFYMKICESVKKLDRFNTVNDNIKQIPPPHSELTDILKQAYINQ